jgi:hypothetical protein
MSDAEVFVTVEESPVTVEITDNTPTVTVTDVATTEVTVIDASTYVTVTADATPNVTVFMGSGGGIGTTWLEPTPADVARVLHVLEGAITEDQLSQAMHVEWLYNRAQLIQGVGNYSLLFTDLGIERTRIDLLQPVVSGLVHDMGLLDYAVNTQLNALYQANQDHSETLFDHEERLESQTSRIIQAEDKITLHVGQIKSLDDGLTETNANIGIVADAINLTVSQNAIDADNRMSASENSIILNTEAIALRVTAHEETYQRVSDTIAEIAVERYRITSNVESVEVLQGEMITANSNITQTATAILASIETINEAQGTIDQATIGMTALGATLTASTEALNDATQVVAASQSIMSDKWAVTIKEGIGGARYATGFGLNLNPDWAIGKTYAIGNKVFYTDKIWECQAPHVGNALLNPIPDNHDYWLEDVDAMKSEFLVEADSFRMYTPGGSSVAPFSISGDLVQINTTTTFASPSTVRTQLNVADGADVTANSAFAANVLGTLDDIYAQLDGVVTSWFYAYDPTLLNIPYTDWITPDTRADHTGDLFYNTTTGNSFRFQFVSPNYQWVLLSASGVATALANAAAAQDTADHKRRVFIATPIPPYEVGDLWDNAGSLMRCGTPKILGQLYVTGDWVLASTIGAPTGTLVAGTAAATLVANAATAITKLGDIASDSILTPGEKPTVIKEYEVIIAEQSGIGAQATSYGITTEKTAYDAAITALTSYLATLTSTVLWSNITGNTAIVGTTFRTKFKDVYSARQTLLGKITSVSTVNQLAGSGVNVMPPRYATFEEAALPPIAYTGPSVTLSQDATIKNIGTKSLKMAVTTADLFSCPVMNLPPNKKWILSAYVYSTAVIKTLAWGSAGVTVAIESALPTTVYKPIITAGEIPANTWTRISGVIDLSTYANTIFDLRIDSHEANRTVWFDGIMLEAQVGTQTTPSAFHKPDNFLTTYTGALNATTNQSDTITNNAITTASGTATWAGVTGTGKPANNADATSSVDLAAQINNATTTIDGGKISCVSLSALSANLGTITAGYLRNVNNRRFINLDATNDQHFLHIADDISGEPQMWITANGGGYIRHEWLSTLTVLPYQSYARYTIPGGVYSIYFDICGGGGGGINSVNQTFPVPYTGNASSGGGAGQCILRQAMTVAPGGYVDVYPGAGGGPGANGAGSSIYYNGNLVASVVGGTAGGGGKGLTYGPDQQGVYECWEYLDDIGYVTACGTNYYYIAHPAVAGTSTPEFSGGVVGYVPADPSALSGGGNASRLGAGGAGGTSAYFTGTWNNFTGHAGTAGGNGGIGAGGGGGSNGIYGSLLGVYPIAAQPAGSGGTGMVKLYV